MGRKVCLRCKGKTLLVVVWKQKNCWQLTSPSSVLPYYLKLTLLPIIWIFTKSEGDGIESRLSFQIFSILPTWEVWLFDQIHTFFFVAYSALQYITLNRTYSNLNFLSHSITLLVVANHSFYNLLTLVFGTASIAMMKSNANFLTSKATYGWNRMEVVGSMISLVFLSSLCFGTATEALQTISHRCEISGFCLLSCCQIERT